jgi:hypothetical protein
MIKKTVYICYPFRSNDHATQEENIKAAQRIAAKIREEDKYVPIVTHGMFPHLNDDDHRKIIMDLCKGILSVCKQVWICSRIISPGMAEEIAFADVCNITTMQMYDEFEEADDEKNNQN